jgi:hypothetical protein
MKSKLVLIILVSAFILISGILILRAARRAGQPPDGKKPAPSFGPARHAVRTVSRGKPGMVTEVPPDRQVVRKQAKAQAAPRIAIVIDDFGYNMNNIEALFAVGEPVTLSILPGQPYSRRIAQLAAEHGYETMLHLPLESHRGDVREEFDTIRGGMGKEEILERIENQIADVPGLKGVSNHMGSRSTEDPVLMTEIFVYLKKMGLYFFDSLTSQNTVCADVSARVGLPFARRDVFLDNSSAAEYIKKQLTQARKIALKKGRAIAVCHDRKSTIAVLADAMPRMSAEGIRFVSLSELVK